MLTKNQSRRVSLSFDTEFSIFNFQFPLNSQFLNFSHWDFIGSCVKQRGCHATIRWKLGFGHSTVASGSETRVVMVCFLQNDPTSYFALLNLRSSDRRCRETKS